jgi:hypothetical protein
MHFELRRARKVAEAEAEEERRFEEEIGVRVRQARQSNEASEEPDDN